MMSEKRILNPSPECVAPEVGWLLTSYCFGRATAEEAQQVKAHLPICASCHQEATRLRVAVRLLDTDAGLIASLPAQDVATSFGPSARLELPWGGHRWHAMLSCAAYALLYSVALVVEVAYQFDAYRSASLWGGVGAFVWVFITSMGGLALDWRLTSAGSKRGLAASTGIFLLAAVMLCGAAQWVLPAVPVTQMTTPAMTAQAAYLKTVVYFLLIENLFLLIPFHFVLAMQREMRAGRHRWALGLLTGGKLSVAPQGAVFLRPWMLGVLLATMGAVAIHLHFNLINHLTPGAYQNLFTHLIQFRLLLYFAFGGKCLVWYQQMLNEVKRECLAANSGN